MKTEDIVVGAQYAINAPNAKWGPGPWRARVVSTAGVRGRVRGDYTSFLSEHANYIEISPVSDVRHRRPVQYRVYGHDLLSKAGRKVPYYACPASHVLMRWDEYEEQARAAEQSRQQAEAARERRRASAESVQAELRKELRVMLHVSASTRVGVLPLETAITLLSRVREIKAGVNA